MALAKRNRVKTGRYALGDAVWLNIFTRILVEISWRIAPVLLLLFAVGTIALGWYAKSHLSMDTRTSRLLDPDLPWRQQEIALNDAFPQNKRVLAVVVEGATPEIASKAARDLYGALDESRDAFISVSYPEGSDFFRRNGLLFLDKPELEDVTEKLVAAQGMLAKLAADPTLHGLFSALDLALEGVERNEIDAASLDTPISTIADVIEANLAGKPAYLAWGKLFTGREPAARERLQVITVRPALDYTSLSPGRRARLAVEAAAERLALTPENGVTVQFTGDVALDDDEFASVKEGIGIATVLSLTLVIGLLTIAIRAARPVIAVVITLFVGLIWTSAFAAATVRELNLVSVAFVVMFIGIAVDFSIQFCVRLRDEHVSEPDIFQAALNTGSTVGGALLLAAITTAIGFLAFVPTAYRGVSELGIVAGGGMLIALVLNITLLPALLRYLHAPAEANPPYLLPTTAVDDWITAHRRLILAAAVACVGGAFVLLPHIRFDFNPLNLKDPDAPSVLTLDKLLAAGMSSTNSLQVLVQEREEIADISPTLKALPEVDKVLSIESFIPKDQDEKIAIIKDAAFLLEPLFLATPEPRPSAEATLVTLRSVAVRLHEAAKAPDAPSSFGRLAAALDIATQNGTDKLARFEAALMGGLSERLSSLSTMLEPEPVSFESLPAELKLGWIASDGRYRIEVRAAGNSNDNSVLRRFVTAVKEVAPEAIGSAYFIQKSGEAVWSAFQEAFAYALIGVIVVLILVLRRITDVALIVGPLIFSALITLAVSVVVGLPINFANVIALPLLMGIGVAFNIYFVTRWRIGLTHPLHSSMARAVVFSAITTLVAVSSLAVSPHAGTASMGRLLTLCLGITLFSALVLLPALLAQSASEDRG